MYDIRNEIESNMEKYKNYDSNYRRFKSSKFPKLTEFTDGFNTGLCIVSGLPNAGKSSSLQYLMYSIMVENPKATVIYSTHDDSASKIIRRFQAAGTFYYGDPVRINDVYFRDKFRRFSHKVQEDLIKWQESGRLKIVDKKQVKDVHSLVRYWKDNVVDTENTFLFVDSILSLKAKGSTDNQMDDDRATALTSAVIELDVPLFVSTHLKKLDDYKNLGQDSLKGSISLAYESDFIMILYYKNEKKFNSGEDKTVVGYICKNKLTEVKGNVYFQSYGQYSVIEEEK